MVPTKLEPLIPLLYIFNSVVITLQNKAFNNFSINCKSTMDVVITFQNKVFNNEIELWLGEIDVVITFQNKIFNNL